MSPTVIRAARCCGSKARRSRMHKLFRQLVHPTRLHGAKPRWQAVIGDSGASLVEFAFSAAVLMGLLFGIMFACLALYTRHFVSEAALAGARWAMVRGSTSCTNTPNLTDCNATAAQIQTYVQGLSFPGIKSQSLTVTPTWCPVSASPPATWGTCTSSTANTPKNAVNVQVSYPFPLQIPIIKANTVTFSTNTLTFSSTAQLVISQ